MNWNVFHHLSESRAVGEPVFFRCLATCAPTEAARTLAETAREAARLIGAPLRSLHARGHLDAGSVQVTLIFGSGATALLLAGPGEPGCDVMLLGNRGGAYLEGSACGALAAPDAGEGADLLPHPTPSCEPRAASTSAASFLSLIHRSLAEGTAVRIDEAVDG